MPDVSEKLQVVSLSQIVASVAASMCAFCVGNALAYTSPALPTMTNENITSFEVSKQQASWVGGIMPLAALVGAISGAPLVISVGRKVTIVLSSAPFIVSWLVIASASSVVTVFIGRFLTGFAVGVASISLPVYVGEAVHPLIRGTLGLMITLLCNFGVLVCFIFGSFTNWSQLAYISAALCLPFLILMLIVPESPRWHLTKGKIEQAEKALTWLRRKNAKIDEELREMSQAQNNEPEESNGFKTMFQKKYLRPVCIQLALMFIQNICGINAVMFYTVMIFNMSGSTVDSYLSTIIVGVVNFLATLIATIVIDHAGRKMLLYISTLTAIVTLFVLSVFFYCKSINWNTSNYGWLPLTSFVLYVLGFSLGLGPIPWLMIGEILPSRIRGQAASLVVAFSWICTFIVTKTFQDMIDLVGIHGAFGFFCFGSIVGLLFIILMVPETKNKSLEEIEAELTGKLPNEVIRRSL
ncbi:facilitated trehalose transporter Tret1-2 homolog [Drosophila innubila]|uniref:facilitated trehalose transporter Tret1-2 homolog n=1 Tax=Drosophila innubila TaxID=198719 RepID=UPI00148B36AC|nr:facilitated trehalose transporter Tret1-2 homolog [Drosophila innubila]